MSVRRSSVGAFHTYRQILMGASAQESCPILQDLVAYNCHVFQRSHHHKRGRASEVSASAHVSAENTTSTNAMCSLYKK